MQTIKGRLILALDVDSRESALAWVRRLRHQVEIFKVGPVLYTVAGPKIIEAIRNTGANVFLDLKLHDIPATVARAAGEMTRRGVSMLTLHAQVGTEAMKRCLETCVTMSQKAGVPLPKLLGITLLTSVDQQILTKELGVVETIDAYVLRLAKLVQQSGLHGVVASPLEVQRIRQTYARPFLLVTPGIRLPDLKRPILRDDQRRVLSPAEAIRRGADYLVVGRPVLSAREPEVIIEAILKEMATGQYPQNG